MPTDREILRTMTFSAYDLQMLRMQVGLRLCANFRNKLKEPEPEQSPEGEEEAPTKSELSEEAKKVVDQLKDSYKRLTDGVARNRRLPAEKGFKGDELISTFTELVLVDQYVRIEKDERIQFDQFENVLEKMPIWNLYLKDQVGIGSAMAAVLISYFDPHKAHHVSGFWSYAGLDVAADGKGRSRRKEHLIDREYRTKEGKIATRKSVTYNPWLKSRLLGALAISFMRTKNCPWRQVYDGYRHRLETDPNRNRVTSAQYKAAFKAEQDVTQMWTPLRIHRASLRYMVKMFLIEFWTKWRELEGLPVTAPYHEAKLGHRHVA